jgi:hypothetical protein
MALRNIPCELDPDYQEPDNTRRSSPPADTRVSTWEDQALQALAEVAATPDLFCSLDVWDKLREWGVPDPPEPRAMGAIMVKGTRLGLCRPTDQFTTTQKDQSNAMPRRLYRGT